MKINIVLIHINCDDTDLYCKSELPLYVEDCLQQIRIFNNCNVYFLTNKINIHNNFNLFDKYNITPVSIEDFHDNRVDIFSKHFYENTFWNSAAIRFFYIENFIEKYKLTNVIHFENDVLIYENLSKYDYSIFNRLAITPGSDKECMTGMFYIKDSYSIRIFNNYMLNIVTNGDIEILKLKYNIDYQINEMNILYIYSKIFGKKYLDYFPILPIEYSDNLENFDSIFDPATFGQFVSGTRLEGSGTKPQQHYISNFLSNETIKFEYVDEYLKPFFFYENKKFLINNLHIHSKKLHLYKSRKKIEYIQGEKFQKLANNNIIYSHTHYANNILKNPPNEKFILITHNGDAKVTNIPKVYSEGIEDANINLIPENLTHWYGQNINIKNSKIESLPIGLENSYNFPELKKIEKLEELSRTVKIENKLLYVNFNINTNIELRKPIYDLFKNKEFVTIKNGNNGFDYDQYLKDLYEHKFVICPEGNGIDTHRTWECLYLGSIPIEKRNINNQFYTDLPICFVNSWEEVTEDFLNKEYDRIKNNKWNLDKLDFNWWKNKIENINNNDYINRIKNAIIKTEKNESILTDDIFKINGISNRKVRNLLSNLTKDNDNYLEIGIYQGSTFISSSFNKKFNSSFAIDNWSEFGDVYDIFINNCYKFLGYKPNYISNDSFSFNPIDKNIKNINVYFYDGNHDELSQYKALSYYYDSLMDDFIFIVDYKHDFVKNGTQKAIKDLNFEIIYDVYLSGSHHNDNEYWDGLYIAYLKKKYKKINSQKIYEKIKFTNYSTLPLEYNNKNWKWEGKDFPRIISLLEFKKFMDNNNNTFNNVLSFNGKNDPEYEYINCNKISNYNYEDDKINNDLHNLNLNQKNFDFVMLNQTLEHLYDPITCLKNIYNHLNDGALFYANVPVNNIPHNTPEHFYTGLTPVGLGAIIELAGFEIIEIGQWGNYDYLQKLFTHGWSDYTNVKYNNEIDCPIITWIFAKKPITIKLEHKENVFFTHQPILLDVIQKTNGNILECGCGYGSTEFIKKLISNTNRKLISLESNKEWYEKFKNDENIHFVDADNEDIESTGQKWVDFFENNELIKNNTFDIIFIDQSPWISRTYTLNYFKDKAKFIIIHDADYFPNNGKWGKFINNEYNFSDIAINFKFFEKLNPPTLLLSNTLTKEEFENFNINIDKYL